MRLAVNNHGRICVDGVELLHGFLPPDLRNWLREIQVDSYTEEYHYYFYTFSWEKVYYTKQDYRKILVFALSLRLKP